MIRSGIGKTMNRGNYVTFLRSKRVKFDREELLSEWPNHGFGVLNDRGLQRSIVFPCFVGAFSKPTFQFESGAAESYRTISARNFRQLSSEFAAESEMAVVNVACPGLTPKVGQIKTKVLLVLFCWFSG